MNTFEPGRKNLIDLNGIWMMKGLEPGTGVESKLYLPDTKPDGCFPCRIPGTVRTALLEVGEIPDPYYGYGNEESLWVEQKEWWFFREFTVPDDVRGKFVELLLDGTTFSGECWLNGQEVGKLKGMFNPRSFEVGRLLNYGDANYIAMRLEAPPDAVENTVERGLTWRIPRDQLFSIAQCMYGWDWGPHAVPVGIWKSVALRVTGPVRIGSPYIRTEIASSRRAVCRIEFEVRNTCGKEISAVLSGSILEKQSQRGAGEFSRSVELSPNGKKKLTFEIAIGNPRLWWPNEMGEQNLYMMDVSVSCGGAESDHLTEQFGIRELKLVENEKVDEFLKTMQEDIGDSHYLGKAIGSYPWTFEINGKKMFAKGGNWIPADQLLRLDHDRYDHLLRLFTDAHFNLLRVWGGGLYETDEFYRLCDQYGILTWQEFLSNRSFSRIDQENFLDGAGSAILRLRNHPCLTFWCGGNEFDPDDEGSKSVIDSLASLLNDLDPRRGFHRASPYLGDDHYWGVWHQLEPYTKYRVVRPFRSEAGLNAPPVWENYVKFTPAGLLWPPDETFVEYHGECNVQFRHLSKLLRYVGEFGEPSNIKDLIAKGQLYQAIGNEFDMEFCRANKFRNSGFLVWQYNDIWPCFSWSIVDWYGTPKPSYYFLKRASRPIHISADFERYLWIAGETFRTDVYLLNDTGHSVSGLNFFCRLIDSGGKVVLERSGVARAKSDRSTKFATIKYTIPVSMKGKAFFMSTLLNDKSGRRISDAIYPMAVSRTGDLDDYTGIFSQLNEMPETHLTVKPVESKLELGTNGKGACELKIANPTGHLAFFVRARLVEESGVFRAVYSDNYISLMPAETRKVHVGVESKGTGLAPHKIHFEVSGINCPKQEIEIAVAKK